ncbi:MAG: DNA-binding domain-containing protein, partial [Burkholderiales bacterium]|nr:DNA-binding domain-containing protein [Burkholderiales bacterium]
MSASTIQGRFAKALLDPRSPTPRGVSAWNGSDPQARFAVYRNNVVSSLVDALAEAFPVVEALVGEEFFREMARIFVLARPPRSPVLFEYGDLFPAFVAAFEPALSVPYLADVAHLEAARVRAYHAADVDPAGPEILAGIDPSLLLDVTVTPHPSASVIASPHAVFSLWAAHQGALDIGDVDPFVAEDALVMRPGVEVEVTRLAPGAVTFLGSLMDGGSLGI